MANPTDELNGQESQHYLSARQRRRAGGTKMQPPMVPMIDVTFQLLIYFLLTAEFRMAEGQIAGTVPEKGEVGSAVVVPIEPIRVAIRSSFMEGQGAAYEVGGKIVDTGDKLFVELVDLQKRGGGAEVPVILAPDPHVAWQFVTEAFNQAVRAKFKRVGFAPTA